MQIIYILSIPIFLAMVSFCIENAKLRGYINVLGHILVLFLSVGLINNIAIPNKSVSLFNFFYIDALSIFFIFTIAFVNLATALYSINYIAKDTAAGIISPKKAKVYYILFNLFAFTMFFVTVVNNLGMLWVAIEMTTLVSAFLVGFYNTKQSVEAAWKYIIICSVGIIFALLGTVLFSYALSTGAGIKSLNWTDMVSMAPRLDKNIIKIAFIFILVGFGTKAGLAPMHTWLPDAHSQAVSPASALLSGVLLKTAIYAILRFSVIANKVIEASFFGHIMILLGLVSLGISAAFLLIQKDLKRLLAYSSIEHIGIISIGLGLGGALASFGAILHIFNHAMTKSLMFFGAGDLVSKYQRHNINSIKGAIGVMPFTGVMLILGVFALAGFPPFSIFISEIFILMAAFTKGSFMVAFLFLFFIGIIFGALIFHFGKMLFGRPPQDLSAAGQPLSGKLAFILLLVPICVIGITIPVFLQGLIQSVLKVLGVI